jgi:hypothetical protein
VIVAGETKGRWGKAEQVPGIAGLNPGKLAWIYSVSCASPGNCAAGGYYTNGSTAQQAFVADKKNGTWGHGPGHSAHRVQRPSRRRRIRLPIVSLGGQLQCRRELLAKPPPL